MVCFRVYDVLSINMKDLISLTCFLFVFFGEFYPLFTGRVVVFFYPFAS